MACEIIDCKFVLYSSDDICCLQYRMEPGWLSRYSDWLGLGNPGFESHRVTGTFSRMSWPALGPTEPSVQWTPNVLSPSVKRRNMKFTAYLHLIPRWKMSEAVSLLPQYAFMVCTRTLHLYDVATVVSSRATRISDVLRVVVRMSGGVKVWVGVYCVGWLDGTEHASESSEVALHDYDWRSNLALKKR